MNTLFFNEHRCACGKLLLKGVFFDASLEIKCKKCGTINKIGSLKLADDATRYLLIVDNRGMICNVSESASRILGYTRDELVGKHFTKINPTMSEELGKKFFRAESVLSEDNYLKLDTFHQSKDGKKIPVTVLLKLYRPTGKEKYILLSAALKNSEVARDKKAFEKNAPDFLDHSCDFWFEIDTNGIGEYVSPSVEKLFGFQTEAIIGMNYFDIFPAETRTESKKMFDHFSAQEQPYRVVNDIGRDADDRVRHNELYFVPKFSDTGKFCGYRVLGWVKKRP